MTAPAVSIRGVGRRFGSHDVLRGLSLDVPEGEVFALVGANGSGKSTLLEILATLLLPTAGTALILGHDVVADPVSARRAIGYGGSSLHSFYPRLTGRQNLEFFAILYGMDRASARRRSSSLLERLALSAARDERVERYSDGMKGRLALARALLTDAPVLLLDEPTKSLDAGGKLDARALILHEDGARSRPRTVLWVTHDEAEAKAVASRAGVLRNGAIA